MPLLLTIANYELNIVGENPTSENALGECEPLESGNYNIRISPALSDRAFVETTVHELIEAVNCIYDLELNHTQIQTLGVALSEVLPIDQMGPYLRAALAPKMEPKKPVKKKQKP